MFRTRHALIVQVAVFLHMEKPTTTHTDYWDCGDLHAFISTFVVPNFLLLDLFSGFFLTYLLVKFCSLLQCGPNRNGLNHRPKQCSLELIEEMIVLVQEGVLLSELAGDRQLYFIGDRVAND